MVQDLDVLSKRSLLFKEQRGPCWVRVSYWLERRMPRVRPLRGDVHDLLIESGGEKGGVPRGLSFDGL